MTIKWSTGRQMSTTMRAPCALWDTRCNRVNRSSRWFNCLFIAIVLIGVLPLSSPALAQTVTQCQENEVLLHVDISYQPKEDSNAYLDISVQGPRAPNTDTTNQSNIESFYYTQQVLDNGTMVTDNNISLCVPEDQCLLVVAKLFSTFPVYYEDGRYQLPSDEISIVYNGQIWSDKKGPFAYSISGTMVVAELGPCEVICESEDALLEIEAITGYSPVYDWQILEDATGHMIQHCPAPFQNSSICYWESEQYYHERLCLPRESCYTLLVAEQSSAILEFDAKSLHAYFHGKHLESFEYLRFINVPLSDGSTVCDTTYCDSDSTLVELYFFRQEMDMDNRNLTWSLSTVDGSQPSGDLGIGIVTSDDRALQYYKECIPKVDSCIQFSTSVADDAAGANFSNLLGPTTFGEGDYQENVTFRFAIDGILYNDYYFEFGYSDDNINGTFEFSYPLGNCSYSQNCGNNSYFYLAQVDIVTGPAWQTAAVVPFTLSSRSEAGEETFTFYLDLYPDQRFLLLFCIPELWFRKNNTDPEYCTEFGSSELQFYNGNGSYNTSVYVVPFPGQQTAGTWRQYNDYGQVTRLAGHCKDGSSSESARERIFVGYKVSALATIILGGLFL